MLNINDKYMIIKETNNYIKMTTGQIRDITKYSVKEVQHILKHSEVLLSHYKLTAFSRTLDNSEKLIQKVKSLGVSCAFVLPYKKYDDNNKFNKKYARLLAKGSIVTGLKNNNINIIDTREYISDDDLIALDLNLRYILDDINKYNKKYLVKNVDKHAEVLYRVPNTNWFVACTNIKIIYKI